jgi:hypothetical protein
MKNLLNRIFGKKTRNESDSIPPRPKDWSLTISDLMKEMKDGKRAQVGQPELEWAREYQRSLIPKDYRFPKRGDLYESKFDQIIEFLTEWQAPYTGSGESTLFKGEKIWISSNPSDDKPIRTYALPVDYKELELRMVSATDRNAPKYGGFYLSIDTKDLNENFTLIRTGFSKALDE